LDLGYGYAWLHGSGLYQEPTPAHSDSPTDVQKAVEQGSVDVNTNWYFGFAGNAGARNDGSGVGGSLSASAFIGMKDVGVSAGYDVIGKTAFFGLGAKLDVFSVKRGSGTDVCFKGKAF
jgi:hypothetical protein